MGFSPASKRTEENRNRARSAPANPPPLPGIHPDFRLSYHPWDDLSVTEDGRLVITPAKDAILPGLHGITLDRAGLHAESLRRHVEDRCHRIALLTPDEYRYCYRTADEYGPAQYVDVWTSIVWVHDRPTPEVDLEGYVAYVEALAWSSHPTPQQIAEAEERTGRKVAKRPKE